MINITTKKTDPASSIIERTIHYNNLIMVMMMIPCMMMIVFTLSSQRFCSFLTLVCLFLDRTLRMHLTGRKEVKRNGKNKGYKDRDFFFAKRVLVFVKNVARSCTRPYTTQA